VADVDVWNAWGVTYRDVYILDRENALYAVYNLTDHPLSSDANREELKALLRAAGTR
jgi:hypothetical protein